MTKNQFILWATSRGFTEGRYHHLTRRTNSTEGQLIYTERLRFLFDTVVYEILTGKKFIVKNYATGTGNLPTINWSWEFVRRIRLKWIQPDKYNNCDGFDIMPPNLTPDFFPV